MSAVGGSAVRCERAGGVSRAWRWSSRHAGLKLPCVSEADLADSQSQCPQQEAAVGWPVWTDEVVWSLCSSQVCQRTRGSVCPVVLITGQRPGEGAASCMRQVLRLALDPLSSRGEGRTTGETGSGRHSWLT